MYHPMDQWTPTTPIGRATRQSDMAVPDGSCLGENERNVTDSTSPTERHHRRTKGTKENEDVRMFRTKHHGGGMLILTYPGTHIGTGHVIKRGSSGTHIGRAFSLGLSVFYASSRESSHDGCSWQQSLFVIFWMHSA